MAADTALFPTEVPDTFDTVTFGPFAATQADLILPFLANRRLVIDQVIVNTRVIPSVASNFNLFRRIQTINSTNGGTGSGSLCGRTLTTQTGDTTVASTVTAARSVITQFDLNTLVINTPTVLPLKTGTDGRFSNNVLEPGDQLVADFATTTAMADMYITVRYHSVPA